MKRKTGLIILTCMLLGFGCLLFTVPVLADGMKSRGIFIFQQGSAAFYSDDIQYIQAELSKLFQEID